MNTDKIIKNFFLLLSVYFWLFSCVLEGSFEQRGLSSRAVALGEAYTAISDDAYASLYNPAGLSQIKSYRLGLSYFKIYQVADFSTFYAALLLPIKETHVVSISESLFGSLGYYAENTTSISYGVQAINVNEFRINLGLSLHYLSKSIFNGAENNTYSIIKGFGVDIGLLVISPLTSFITIQLGCVYQKKEIDNIKDNINTGLSFLLIERFNTSIDYDINNKQIKIGEEITLMKQLLFLRVGLQMADKGMLDKNAGFGLMFNSMIMDYAIQQFSYALPLTHKISLSILF